jgi:hypothetical protein
VIYYLYLIPFVIIASTVALVAAERAKANDWEQEQAAHRRLMRELRRQEHDHTPR